MPLKNPCVRSMSIGLCVLCVFASAQAQQPQVKNPAGPQSQESHQAVSVETRPQLFAVLCALDAAGFDSATSTLNESPGRVQLRRRMLALQGPAVEALREYYVGSSRVDLQACKLEYSIVSPK